MNRFQLAILGLALCGCGGGSGSSSSFNGSGGGTTFTNITTTTTTTTGNQSQASFNLSLTSNGNANVTPIASGALLTRADTFASGSPTNRVQTTLYSTVVTNQQNNQRALALVISKNSGITVGDTFTFSTPATLPGALGLYNENDPNGNRGWTSTGGTITVNSISTNSISVTVTNLQLTPLATGGNTANGTITVNGSATLPF
ncbi:MAG: hypothetical protein J0I12_28480 [Candidatus Eremiobacteraeota bacterium]|nr:hypothetical protein [Candidatus Eremiobacteraeota bacterium]